MTSHDPITHQIIESESQDIYEVRIFVVSNFIGVKAKFLTV